MNKSIKLHVYAAVAAGLALSPIAAHAQTSPTTDAGGSVTTSEAPGDRNDHHDYGWLGLAGLLGLIGLMRRSRNDRHDTAGSATQRSDLSGVRR